MKREKTEITADRVSRSADCDNADTQGAVLAIGLTLGSFFADPLTLHIIIIVIPYAEITFLRPGFIFTGN